MSFAVWDFIFRCPFFQNFPSVAFTCAAQTSTGASHWPNRAGLELRWCRYPIRLSKPHTGSHRASCGFLCPKTRLPLPLKGEGLGFIQFGVVQFSLGSCPWQLPLTNGSHGSSGAGLGLWWCRSPTWRPKPHTGPHRAEFGFHRFFLVCFFCGSPANWRSRW